MKWSGVKEEEKKTVEVNYPDLELVTTIYICIVESFFLYVDNFMPYGVVPWCAMASSSEENETIKLKHKIRQI